MTVKERDRARIKVATYDKLDKELLGVMEAEERLTRLDAAAPVKTTIRERGGDYDLCEIPVSVVADVLKKRREKLVAEIEKL